MGWFSELFVTSKTVDKVVDSAIAAGDKLFYTEEEKADGRARVRDWYLDLLASMKPFNIAMRVLSMGVFSVWALHVLLSTSMYVLSFFLCDAPTDGKLVYETCRLSAAAEAIEGQLEKNINRHFGVIIMFYFGAAGINSAIVAAKGKK